MRLNDILVFDITEGWKSYSSSDPSDLYILSTRLGGVLCLIVGIVGIVVFLLV